MDFTALPIVTSVILFARSKALLFIASTVSGRTYTPSFARGNIIISVTALLKSTPSTDEKLSFSADTLISLRAVSEESTETGRVVIFFPA